MYLTAAQQRKLVRNDNLRSVKWKMGQLVGYGRIEQPNCMGVVVAKYYLPHPWYPKDKTRRGYYVTVQNIKGERILCHDDDLWNVLITYKDYDEISDNLFKAISEFRNAGLLKKK